MYAPKNSSLNKKPAEFAFYRLEILSIVQESSSLPDGSLVEDRSHSLNKRVIKTRHSHSKALFLRFPNLVSGLSINLFVPPKGIALDRKRRDRLPLHLVGILWFCVRQTLPEGQNIWAILTLLKLRQ